jgi:serine/threonine protein kinase
MQRSVALDQAIAERYAITELLGEGGFAKVYRGRQLSTGHEVAIKLSELDRGPCAPPAAVQVERFRHEAKLCSALRHPNIVPLIEFGETSAGQVYGVFTRVPARDLSMVLAAEGQLEPAEAFHLMSQVLDALACAHARGIVHRDLKPENILISGAGARRDAQVFDFGIGAVLPDRPERVLRRLTQCGAYLGTPAYAAPEQLRGEPPSPLSDLYSWGLIFLECLTGQPAVSAKGPHEAVHMQLSPAPIALPEALRRHELGELLQRATHKKSDRRSLETSALKQLLQRLDPRSLPARNALARRSSKRPLERNITDRQRSPVWLMPCARNPSFTGRSELLQRIADALAARQGVASVALHGMAGVGKSHLALEYAHRFADRYRVVAWLRAETADTVAADYIALGRALGFSETPDRQQRIEEVQAWLERNTGWLLIFDNVQNPAAIRGWLPCAHAGHVLLTSRHPGWRDVGSSVAVDVMPQGEAIAFLIARSAVCDETTAGELSEELGRLPLALDEAAAYMETTGATLREYLELLRTQRQRSSFGGLVKTEHVPPCTTWELSFQQVERESAAAADFLRLCAFLAPDDIPVALIQRGQALLPEPLRACVLDAATFDACIATLRKFSLITAEGAALSLHRSVQLATRERLCADEHARWALISLAVVEAAYPRNPSVGDYRPECARFLPHALVTLAYEHTGHAALAVAARLRCHAGLYLSARGSHLAAWDLLQQALAQLEAESQPDVIQIVSARRELGLLLYALGEADAAREQLEHGLRAVSAAHGGEELGAELQLSLAWVQRARGDFRAGAAAAHTALTYIRGSAHADDQLAAAALSIAARCHFGSGELAAAHSCMNAALEILGRIRTPEHPLDCGTWLDIAQLQYDSGKFRAALDSAGRGLVIGRRAYGRDHPLVSSCLSIRGACMLRLGDPDAARVCLERALEGGQRACRRLHEEIASARSQLADALRQGGDHAAARAQIAHALDELPRLCGDVTRLAANAHAISAALQRDQGNLAAAREQTQLALRVLDARYAKAHPVRLPALNLLGAVARLQGDLSLAETTYKEAASIDAHADAALAAQALAEVRAQLDGQSSPRNTYIRSRTLFARSVERARGNARRRRRGARSVQR